MVDEVSRGTTGRVGQGLQIGGSLLGGAAMFRQASELDKSADRQRHINRIQTFRQYRDFFDDLGQQTRRVQAAQQTAVAVSGVAMEGSAQMVLDEAIQDAKKTRVRATEEMKMTLSEIDRQHRQQRREARSMRVGAVISTTLGVGGALI